MPQLEIHHEDGNVTYAELSPARPLLIGSASNCDVVLAAEGVKRVHCRIVSRDGRWRVEVAADAGTVQLGDKQVKAGTIRGGDVLGIGGCRIYMDETAAAAEQPREPAHYAADLLDQSSAADEAAVAPVLDRGSIRKKSHMQDTRGAWTKFWESFRRTAKEQFQGEVDRPPGQERILGSPLVRWMAGGVVILAIAGVIFYLDYHSRQILAHFDNAQTMMNNANWEGASRRFETFIEEYPTHKLASTAHVQKAMCEVEAAAAGSPAAGIGSMRKLLREQSKEPAFQGLVPKLGDLVARLAQGLAEAARDKADIKLLDQCEEAQEMLKRELNAATISADAQAKLDDTIAKARDAIRKLDDFLATRDKMDRSIAAGTTWPVYSERERLVQLYGKEFEEHADVVDRMKQANRLDLDHVEWVGGVKNPETEWPKRVVLAETTLVDRREFGTAPASSGNVVFCLAAGRISAHEVANGNLIWSIIVGTDAHWLPVPVPGATGDEPVVLVTDTRHDELLAVRSRSRQLVWRQPLGEPIEAAPLVHRNKVYQPTGKGNLFVIDARTGRIDGRLQFGEQRFYTTPVPDASGNHLFLLGEQYVMYVLTLAAPLKCESVVYLAHRPDSIFATPLRMERYLVLYENTTASTCQMRVFLIEPDGTTISEIQRPTPLTGWVHHAPSVVGNLKFVATDVELVEVWSGGPPEKAEGYKKESTAGQATTLPGTRPQAYSIAYTEKDLLVHGTMVRHYDYKKEQGVLTPTKQMLEGASIQPIQRYPATGNTQMLFVARQIPGGSAVLFTALDAATLEPRWEVQLGTSLSSLLPADATGSGWIALTRSGSAYSIPTATLTAGGVLDKPTVRTDPPIEISDRMSPFVLPDGSSIYAPSGPAKSLFIRGAGPAAPIRAVELPAALQAHAAFYDDGVLVPAADGRIYWFSSVTGKQLAEPFQPPLSSDQPLEWRGVGLSGPKTIIAAANRGNIYQIELRKEPVPHLTTKNESSLGKKIRSELAISGNVVCCVDEEDTLHVLEAEGLTPIGKGVKLSGPASLGPVATGGFIFVVAGDDEFVCVNAEGQLAWRHPLKGETVVGQPLVQSDAVHFVTTNGLLRALRLADGSEKWTLDAEIPLAGGPVAAGDSLVVVGVDGNLNVVKAPAPGN